MAIYTPGNIYVPGRGEITTKINQGHMVKQETDMYGTYHMAQRPDLYEPLRLNNFEFQIYGLQEALNRSGDTLYNQFYNDSSVATGKVNPGGQYAAEEVIRVSVDSAFIPHFTQNVVQVKRGNSTLKYAGAPTFQNGQIRIKDYIGMNAKIALMAWQNLSYNVKTEKIGLASSYKLDCYLREYTPDYIKVREWLLKGCWISGISEGTFDASSSDNLNQITATIEYDKAELQFDNDYSAQGTEKRAYVES